MFRQSYVWFTTLDTFWKANASITDWLTELMTFSSMVQILLMI